MSSWQEERLCGLRTQRGEMINTPCALSFVWIGHWAFYLAECLGSLLHHSYLMVEICIIRLFMFYHNVTFVDGFRLFKRFFPKKSYWGCLARLEPAILSARGQWQDIHLLFRSCTYHGISTLGSGWIPDMTRIFPYMSNPSLGKTEKFHTFESNSHQDLFYWWLRHSVRMFGM